MTASRSPERSSRARRASRDRRIERGNPRRTRGPVSCSPVRSRNEYFRPVLVGLLLGMLAWTAFPRPDAGVLPTAAQAQAQTSPNAQRLYGWGGYSAIAPENTIAAIEAARTAGVPRLWLDLRATQDGQLVLMRDANLDRTTDCAGPVASLPAASVTACDAGSWFDPSFAGQRVPLLSQALEAAGDADLVLELHAGDPIALVTALQVARIPRVTVVARDRAALRQLAMISSIQFRTRLRVERLESDLIAGLEADGIAGLAVAPAGLAAAPAESLLDAGLSLAVVDADDEGAVLSALQLGAEAIAVARLEPAIFVSSLAFRSYDGSDFGLSPSEDQQLGGGLTTGDFDADGQSDLVLGAPGDDAAGLGAGWLGVLIGEAEFPGRLVADPGDEAQGAWGSPLMAVDLGGDDYEDLVVGVPERDFNGSNSGAIWLRDGTAGGIGGFKRPIGPQPETGSRLGRSLAAGDFDGDGLTDLFVSAPEQQVRGQPGAGRVFLLPGQAGSGAVTTGMLPVDREPEEVPGDPRSRENLGAALASGDFNGDGFDDLAIGAPGANPADIAGAGAVLLVFGGPLDEETGDFLALRYVDLHREDEAVPGFAERDAAFGSSLAAADWDGDGFDDLAVGAPGATAGSQRGAGDVALFFGRADTGTPGEPDEETGAFDLPRTRIYDQASGAMPVPPAGRAAFGSSLAAADWTGDGRPELLVASGESADRLQGAGALYALFGSAEGPDPYRPVRLAPGMAGLGIAPVAGQAFGSRMAAGDLNGDGAPDLALGAPGSRVAGQDRAGQLLVAFGYHPDLPGVPTPTDRPAAPTASPTPTFPVTPSITPTASDTPPASPTPTATRTPRPPAPAYLPMVLRIQSFYGRYPTPAP